MANFHENGYFYTNGYFDHCSKHWRWSRLQDLYSCDTRNVCFRALVVARTRNTDVIKILITRSSWQPKRRLSCRLLHLSLQAMVQQIAAALNALGDHYLDANGSELHDFMTAYFTSPDDDDGKE